MGVLRRVRWKYGYRLVTLASFHHQLAADEEGLEHVTAGDVVVTHDWGVAARVDPTTSVLPKLNEITRRQFEGGLTTHLVLNLELNRPRCSKRETRRLKPSLTCVFSRV